MNFGILGGGFGIYGWLSALKDNDEIKIHTLTKYKENIFSRDEFYNIRNKIIWDDLEDNILKNSDILIIARRPIDQLNLLRKIVINSYKCSLILEKPIAPSPDESEIILKEIKNNKNNIIINFTLNQTNWANKIIDAIKSKSKKKIFVKWDLMAYHYKHHKKNSMLSWKAYKDAGGGALRFYCIHLVHLFSLESEWNHVELINKDLSNEDIFCNIRMNNDYLDVNIICDTKNHNHEFKVLINDEIIINSIDPFIEDDIKYDNTELDRRVNYLKKVVNQSLDNQWFSDNDIARHIKLWKKIESNSF